MEFVIFDLEWNNAYNYATKKGINEIIEIGAVKLNERLEITDTFKQLIMPQMSKKLGSRFKNLTHITMEEIRKNGIPFDTAFSDFARWSSGCDTVFVTWSNSDLYTLTENFKYFKNTADIGFIHKYADAQKYCMQFIENQGGNQISLAHCAEIFEIDVDTSVLHRALEDCYLTACCLKKVYDSEKFKGFIRGCDRNFFERLVFKKYFLTDKDKRFNPAGQSLQCLYCRKNVKPLRKYEFSNNTFKSAGICDGCGKKFWIFVRARQTYDGVVVTKRLVPINKKRAKHIN